MIQDRAIFTIADQYNVAYGLSNGAIFSDLERPQNRISKSDNCLTLNISVMAKDTAIITMEDE